VVTCFALCLGMGSAPKQELMINLACLTHPPQTQTTSHHLIEDVDMSMMHMVRAMWNAPSVPRYHLNAIYTEKTDARDSFAVDDLVNLALNQIEPPVLPSLTPADKWMIELQKRIAEDRVRQEEARRRPVQGGRDPRPQDGDGLPGGEVPHRPVGGGRQDGEDRSGDGRDDDGHHKSSDGAPTGGPRDAPRPLIDPRLCKKSPNTQAAAATLTMSELYDPSTSAVLQLGYADVTTPLSVPQR
jgi:hypothetical protein